MSMSEPEKETANTIKLAERRVFSPSFKPLYNEGMRLVEQAAEYLDGQGRAEAKKLSRPAATLYAAESMRLTTRLMQVASWLLLQRAANSGEMTRDQVAAEKSKVRLDTASVRESASAVARIAGGLSRSGQPLAQLAERRAANGRADLWGKRRCARGGARTRRQPGLRPDHPAQHGLRARLIWTVASFAARLARRCTYANIRNLFPLCSQFAGNKDRQR